MRGPVEGSGRDSKHLLTVFQTVGNDVTRPTAVGGEGVGDGAALRALLSLFLFPLQCNDDVHTTVVLAVFVLGIFPRK